MSMQYVCASVSKSTQQTTVPIQALFKSLIFYKVVSTS